MFLDLGPLEAVAASLTKAERAIDRAIGTEIITTARAIRRDASTLAREHSRRFANSMEASGPHGAPLTANILEAEVGSTLFWGHIVEYGSSQQPPHPAIGPAADKHLPELATRMAALGVDVTLR